MRRFYSICIFILGAALAFAKPQIQSSSPELQKVFDGIKLVDGVWTAVIPDGKYRIAKDAEGNAIRIHGQENIAIIGSKNVEIIEANPSRDFIEIRNSKNILIKGFCVDLAPLPFLQGEIIDVIPEKSAIRVKIPPELLNPDSPTFDFIREKHPGNVSIYPKGETFSYIANPGRPIFKGSEKAGDDTWDIELTFIEERFTGGTLLMYGWFNGWLSSIMGSENIVLDGIRTYCVTGGNFFLMHNDGDITVRNCVVRPRDGTSYLWAADGGNQGTYNAGTVTFENNDFLRINDDGFNMGSFFITVMEKIGPNTVKIDEGDTKCFRPGDEVEIWSWKDKMPTLKTQVVSSTTTPDHKVVLELVDEVGEIIPGERDTDRPRQMVNDKTRIINITRSGKIVLRGNRISSFRARGALVKAQNAVIEKNMFYNMSMPSLLIGPEFYWEEGPGVTNMTIRGNKFMNVRTTAIDIASRGVESPAINNSKILIENNEFYYSDSVFSLEPPHRERHGNAIFVDNAENITIRNNKFFGFPDKDRVIMTGRDTKDIHIEKNRFRGAKAAAEK